MKINTPMEIKGYLFNPAILTLSVIVFCIIFSLMVLFYEIYKIIKRKCMKRKKINDNINQNNQTEANIG